MQLTYLFIYHLLTLLSLSKESKKGQSNIQDKGLLKKKPTISDEFEPSWLAPYLELKKFQLGSARFVTFFTLAQKQKLAKNEPKIGQK
jgi:hypothetical protein